MTIRPFGHRVVVKQLDVEEVDKNVASARRAGLIVETNEREQASVDKGTVVAIGPTAFKDFGGDAWCEIGDVIAFAKYSGKGVKDPDDNIEYIILNDEDCVCEVKETREGV